jgi:hypothetical protein
MKSIEKFLKTLEKRSWHSVSNPMLLRMIVELFDDNLDFELNETNLFSIYDEFVAKMIGKLAEKGPEAKNDSTQFIMNVNIIECHQKKAAEVMFGGKSNELSAAIDIFFKHTPDLSIDQMTRIGLVFDDGSGELHFIHRTFVEFFVAKFIVEKMFKLKFQSEEELNAVADLWMEAMRMSDGEMIRKFLDEEMKRFEFDKNQKLVVKSMEKSFGSFRRDVLRCSARDCCMNLIRFVSINVIEDREKLLKIWIGCTWIGTVLMYAAKFQSIEFVEELWNFAVKIFTQSQVVELLMHENKGGGRMCNVLHFAVANESDEEPFKFFLQKAREILNAVQLKRFTAPKSPLWYWEDKNAKIVLSRCKKTFAENEFRNLLKSRNYLDETLPAYACGDFEDAESLEFVLNELFEFFGASETQEMLQTTTTDYCRTPLMLAAMNGSENIFKTFWSFVEHKLQFKVEDLKQMLSRENKNEWNAFHYATLNGNKENFKFVKQVFEEKLGNEKIKKFLVKENESGENIFHFTIKGEGNEETIETLWHFMQTLLDDRTLMKMLVKRNKKGKSLLDDSGTQRKREIFEDFIARTSIKLG